MNFDPLVALGLSVSAMVAIALPPLLAVLLRRATGVSWKAFGAGALTFFLSQFVLRMPWQIPLGIALQPRLADPVWLWGWLIVSCVSAALFEETGRFLAYRLLWKDRTPAGAMMLGLGHGGLESMLLVGLSLAGSVVVYTAITHGVTLGIPADKLSVVEQQFAGLSFVKALLGGVERVSALTIHVACSLLVLRVFTRGRLGWLFASMGFHTAANLLGVAAAKVLGPAQAEGIIALIAAAAGAFIWSQRPRAPLAVAAAEGPGAASGDGRLGGL